VTLVQGQAATRQQGQDEDEEGEDKDEEGQEDQR